MKKLLVVMVLGASAGAASAQGLQRPRRTSGSHLQRQELFARVVQQRENVGGYTWLYCVNNGEATIMRLARGAEPCAVSPAPKGHVTIPSTLGGAKVTSLGYSAFGFCGEMTSVTIPDAVKEIGGDAFLYCRELTSVKIPDGVTSIGGQAFYGCEKLSSVTIPASVESIGRGAFGWCSQLRRIDLAEGNQRFSVVDDVLYSNDLSELVMCPNVLTTVKIPPEVRKIGTMSFDGCEGLTSVTIPVGVTNIGWCAFGRCSELATVTMLGECPSSPNDVFHKCGKLKAINVSSKCKSWKGMKEWQKLPLVFDGESLDR